MLRFMEALPVGRRNARREHSAITRFQNFFATTRSGRRASNGFCRFSALSAQENQQNWDKNSGGDAEESAAAATAEFQSHDYAEKRRHDKADGHKEDEDSQKWAAEEGTAGFQVFHCVDG